MGDKINLIFDCDGTLIDSYAAITDVICRAFAKHGLDCDPQYVRELCLYENVGFCMEKISEENGLDADIIKEEYKNTKEKTELISLYPNVRKVLEDSRFRCFVYTHRGSSCHEIFKCLGIEDAFADIIDSSYGLEKKPSGRGVEYLVEKYGLDKSATYYVGDRSMDIECGLNAGVGTVFFNSSGLDIDCSRADFAVSDLSEIPAVILR